MNDPIHPPWCQPILCEVSLGGSHTSATHTIPADGQSDARLQTRLWQPTVEGAWTRLEVVIGDHDTGHRCRADLSLGQVMVLADSLDSHLTRAGAR